MPCLRGRGFPQLEAVSFGVCGVAETSDTSLGDHLVPDGGSGGVELREHLVEVGDPEVEHSLLFGASEIPCVLGERGEDRRPGFLPPDFLGSIGDAEVVRVPFTRSTKTSRSFRSTP